MRKKFIITLHNIESHEGYFPRIERIGFRFYLRYLADKVIVFSEYAKKELIRRYTVPKHKIRKTFPETFIGAYKNTISKDKAREILGIEKDRLVLLVFGGIWEYKGIYNLMNFLNKEKNRDYFVVISGKPRTEEIRKDLLEFQKQQEKLVLNLKFVDDKDVQVYMNAADAGLLPYRRITNSGVLFLYGAFKKTIIAKDLSTFREVLGNNAFFYKTEKELKEIIKKTGRRELTKKGELFYESIKGVTWDSIAKETIDIYKEVV